MTYRTHIKRFNGLVNIRLWEIFGNIVQERILYDLPARSFLGITRTGASGNIIELLLVEFVVIKYFQGSFLLFYIIYRSNITDPIL